MLGERPYMKTPSNRRNFLKKLALSGAAVSAAGSVVANEDTPAPRLVVPRRKLGRTGADVSILGLGLGSAFWKTFDGNPEAVEEILLRAHSYGINYWDTARGYENSEILIGPTVEKVRDQVFLVSKSGERSYDGFKADLETSLKNLRTDHIDLYHLHSLNPKKDTDLKLIENGAVKAAREAREQGIIRNFGITGHSGTKILMEGIRQWDPDAILTIFPADRPDEGAYEDKLLPLALARKMGVIAMKSVRHARNTDWPGPQLIRYAMSLNGISPTIVGLDSIAHLDENVAMTSGFTPMSSKEMADMSRIIKNDIASLGAPPWERPGYEDGRASSWA